MDETDSLEIITKNMKTEFSLFIWYNFCLNIKYVFRELGNWINMFR